MTILFSMDNSIDIVLLSQRNPLTRLTFDYGSKVLQKIQENFSEEEQQFFTANMYIHLHYNPEKDCVIKFDNIWRWLGYLRAEACKKCLTKYFVENIDYKVEKKVIPTVESTEGEDKPSSGKTKYNKENIHITFNCFRKLCLKTNTDRAERIHNHFIKCQTLLMSMVLQQSEELKIRLSN